MGNYIFCGSPQNSSNALIIIIIIIIIIIYNLYGGKAPVTRSDFQGGPLRVKIKYTKAKLYNIIN